MGRRSIFKAALRTQRVTAIVHMGTIAAAFALLNCMPAPAQEPGKMGLRHEGLVEEALLRAVGPGEYCVFVVDEDLRHAHDLPATFQAAKARPPCDERARIWLFAGRRHKS